MKIEGGRYWNKPWSLVSSCTRVSDGCKGCWALALEKRFDRCYVEGHIVTHPDRLGIPLKRKKPTVYAVWNDLFHEDVPDEFILDAWMVMGEFYGKDGNMQPVEKRNGHRYLVLTKRPQRMLEFLSSRYPKGFERQNIYHGLTICNQQEADEKIPIFLQVPGKKFLSIEPMLGAVDLSRFLNRAGVKCHACGLKYGHDTIVGNGCKGINAVILGGETGSGARPMHPDWVRSVRDQCNAAGVPFFFKGWGEWGYAKIEDDPHFVGGKAFDSPAGGRSSVYLREPSRKAFHSGTHRAMKVGEETKGGVLMLDEDTVAVRVGKKKAGRLLDGRTHDDLPWRKS